MERGGGGRLPGSVVERLHHLVDVAGDIGTLPVQTRQVLLVYSEIALAIGQPVRIGFTARRQIVEAGIEAGKFQQLQVLFAESLAEPGQVMAEQGRVAAGVDRKAVLVVVHREMPLFRIKTQGQFSSFQYIAVVIA